MYFITSSFYGGVKWNRNMKDNIVDDEFMVEIAGTIYFTSDMEGYIGVMELKSLKKID